MALFQVKEEEIRFAEAKHPALYVVAWSDAIRDVIVRGYNKDGLINDILTTTGDRAPTAKTIPVSAVPIHLRVGPAASGVRRGQLYAVVAYLLGGVTLVRLGEGYLADGESLNYPPGKYESMISDPGLPRSVTGTDPAAGAEITETVPTNALWRLVSARFTLVTDGTVAARRVTVVVDDGVNTLIRHQFGATQAASLTYIYEVRFGEKADLTAIDAENKLIIFLPASLARLFQGWRLRTTTINLQAGDNFGAPQLGVEEWIQE